MLQRLYLTVAEYFERPCTIAFFTNLCVMSRLLYIRRNFASPFVYSLKVSLWN